MSDFDFLTTELQKFANAASAEAWMDELPDGGDAKPDFIMGYGHDVLSKLHAPSQEQRNASVLNQARRLAESDRMRP